MSGKDGVDVVKAGWTCPSCTLHNPPDSLVCSACNNAHPDEMKTKTASTPTKGSRANQAGSISSPSGAKALQQLADRGAIKHADPVTWVYRSQEYHAQIISLACETEGQEGFIFRHTTTMDNTSNQPQQLGSLVIEGKDPSSFMKNVIKHHTGDRPTVLKASEHLFINGQLLSSLQKPSSSSSSSSSSSFSSPSSPTHRLATTTSSSHASKPVTQRTRVTAAPTSASSASSTSASSASSSSSSSPSPSSVAKTGKPTTVSIKKSDEQELHQDDRQPMEDQALETTMRRTSSLRIGPEPPDRQTLQYSQSKPRIAPSTLARYFHMNSCHRFLIFSAYRYSDPQVKSMLLDHLPSPSSPSPSSSSSSSSSSSPSSPPMSTSDSTSPSADGDGQADASIRNRMDAILASGFVWEKNLLERHATEYNILVADNPTKNFSAAHTLELLKSGQGPLMIYQATLNIPVGFYRTLNREHLHFSTCHPDFLELLGTSPHRQLRVIDAKASSSMHFAHCIQVAFYVLILEALLKHAGIADIELLQEGGIWLRDQPSPLYFDLRPALALLREFLFAHHYHHSTAAVTALSGQSDTHAIKPLPPTRLQRLLHVRAPLEVSYRVTPRCNDCTYLPICRRDTKQNNTLSQAAFLSDSAYELLSASSSSSSSSSSSTTASSTSPAFRSNQKDRLESDIEDILRDTQQYLAAAEALASQDENMRPFVMYKARHLAIAVPRLEAVVNKQVMVTGATYVDFPTSEEVQLCFTIQVDPLTNDIFAFAIVVQCLPVLCDQNPTLAQLFASASSPSSSSFSSSSSFTSSYFYGQSWEQFVSCLGSLLLFFNGLAVPVGLQSYLFGQLEAQLLRNHLIVRGTNPSFTPSPEFSAVVSLILRAHDLLSFSRTSPLPSVSFHPAQEGHTIHSNQAWTGTAPVLSSPLKLKVHPPSQSQSSASSLDLDADKQQPQQHQLTEGGPSCPPASPTKGKVQGSSAKKPAAVASGMSPTIVIEHVCQTCFALPVFPTFSLVDCVRHLLPDQQIIIADHLHGNDDDDNNNNDNDGSTGAETTTKTKEVNLHGLLDDFGDEQLYRLYRQGEHRAVQRNVLLMVDLLASLVGGIRRRLELGSQRERAIEPFRLHSVLDYAHPFLARMAFFAQCEVTSALTKIRTSRNPSRDERLLAGSSIQLRCTRIRRANPKRPQPAGRPPINNTFIVTCQISTLLGKLPDADFGNDYPYLLVPDSPAGQHTLRAFDDVRHFLSTGPFWSLSGQPIGFARVEESTALPGTHGQPDTFLLQLKVKTLASKTDPLFQPLTTDAASSMATGDIDVPMHHLAFQHLDFLLHKRYIDDFSVGVLQSQLAKMDQAVRRGQLPLLLQLLNSHETVLDTWSPHPALSTTAVPVHDDDDDDASTDANGASMSLLHSAAKLAIDKLISVDPTLKFTPSQSAIFPKILSAPLQLILGPPGTGKTYFLALTVVLLTEIYRHLNLDLRILLCTSTHLAVEGLLCRIEKFQDILEQQQSSPSSSAPFQRTPTWKLVEWKSTVRPPSIRVRSVPSTGIPPAKLPAQCIIGGTPWSIRKTFASHPPFATVLIFDEASQIPILEASLALDALDWARGGRVVFAGDPYQLGPILQSKFPAEASQVKGNFPSVDLSIFVALQQTLAHRPEQLDRYISQLQENFRMNKTLCAFSADNFYGPSYLPAFPDRVVSLRQPASRGSASDHDANEVVLGELTSLARTIIFDSAQSLVLVRIQSTALLPIGPSHVEAQLTAIIASTLFGAVAPAATQAEFWTERLFVVCPTHIQRLAVRANLQRAGFDMDYVQVDTVEKLQGREADVVIVCYSMFKAEHVLGASDFIFDFRRINVAITRARAKCIFILLDRLLEPAPEVFESPSMIQAQVMLKRLAAQSVLYHIGIDN